MNLLSCCFNEAYEGFNRITYGEICVFLIPQAIDKNSVGIRRDFATQGVPEEYGTKIDDLAFAQSSVPQR